MRKEIRYILIGTGIGCLLQFIAGEYLKRHPDHLNSNSSKDARPPIAKPEKSNPLSKIWIIKKLQGDVLDGVSIVAIAELVNDLGIILGVLRAILGKLKGKELRINPDLLKELKELD